MVDIAQRFKCTHLHPGYGFLSESPSLAQALPESVVFVGPSVETLRVASDKLLSRNLATSLGVKIAPGTRALSSDKVRAFVRFEDFPVIIKALDGGGGRGIRIVESEKDIEEAFNRCMGESLSHRIFVEKAFIGPSWKHIEVQIVGDGTGSVCHLWERECSVQRRHLNYRGLGTFEYLVNAETLDWVFLEINPRIQVEHTVTEEVLGIDLVRTQLRLFTPSISISSLALPSSRPKGCAIQLRLTAEDPSRSFRLSTGILQHQDISWPLGPGIRVDTWLSSNPLFGGPSPQWTIQTEFDSLLAKVIVSGATFEEASQRAMRAMRELRIGDSVSTNHSLLAGVVSHPDWFSGAIDTLWLERNVERVLGLGKSIVELAPSAKLLKPSSETNHAAVDRIESRNTSLHPGALFHLTLSPSSDQTTSAKHSLTLSSISENGFPERLSGVLQTSLSPHPLAFSLTQSTSATVSSSLFELANPNDARHIASPFTGRIVELHPALWATQDEAAGKQKRLVRKGESIVVLSIMKMETTVAAPHDGFVERLGKGVKVGVVLGDGMLICILGSSSTSKL
ncbi:hypothetical protein H0H81_010382 [Sphagnurus paluster]|uniref:Acetyl-CoA carboxylase n=1 Tax=Sphagnurus paluster TaxID=117069 RepID=A0A9P7K7C8_9AGAR|nr:hypothetical protein H0H81_010382 [Sphagnurus paluster]